MAEFTSVYPILLNLIDKQVVVVGGGQVATRKINNLLDAEARVVVISPEITSELRLLVDVERIEWVETSYQRDMLNPYMPVLVIATTDDARVNQIVVQDAHRIRAWVNVTDGSSDESDFSNMSVLHHPPLTIALSTNGSSPALLHHLKAELNSVIGDEYAILADWLGDIRQPLKSEMEHQSERANLYQQVIDSEVLRLLREGKRDEAWGIFQQIVLERTLS